MFGDRPSGPRILGDFAVSCLPLRLLLITKKARRVLWYPTQAKTGLEWGTQPLLTVKQSKKVTAAPTASRGRQDDDSVGVLTKNTLNTLALMGHGPGLTAPNRE